MCVCAARLFGVRKKEFGFEMTTRRRVKRKSCSQPVGWLPLAPTDFPTQRSACLLLLACTKDSGCCSDAEGLLYTYAYRQLVCQNKTSRPTYLPASKQHRIFSTCNQNVDGQPHVANSSRTSDHVRSAVPGRPAAHRVRPVGRRGDRNARHFGGGGTIEIRRGFG